MTPGAVNAEVVLDIGGGTSIAAIVTQESLKALGLAPGAPATALFKASSVILGTMVSTRLAGAALEAASVPSDAGALA